MYMGQIMKENCLLKLGIDIVLNDYKYIFMNLLYY